MTLEVVDYIKKYRDDLYLNIGELFKGTKIPKHENGKIPWHNEINENKINIENGICAFCGRTSNNLMSVDLDDISLLEYFECYFDKTWITKSNRGYHLLFRTNEIPKSRSLTNSKGQHVDILGQGKIIILPPTIHPDSGKPYEVFSDKKIMCLSRIEEERLYQILNDLGFEISQEKKSVKELHDKNHVKTQGQNRSEDLLRVVGSWKIKNPELTEKNLLSLALDYNIQHFDPPYPEDKVRSTVKQGYEFGKKIIEDDDEGKNKVKIYEIANQLMIEYNFITLEKSKEILFYKDGIFREGGEEIISTRSRKLAKNVKLHHINEIKGIIRDETGYLNHDEFDKEPFIQNLKNKTVNLLTGQVLDHSPNHRSRIRLPIFYDSNATCSRFDKFLESSLDGDEQKITMVWEKIALCLIKDNTVVSKAFMNTGMGSNGKSILFGIMMTFLGKENVSAKTIHDFEKNHFASSALEGKLANICADVGKKGINDTEAIKKIISGDPIDCERKFKEGYTFTPFATLIFSANDIPEISDESDGFARRFELIEWEKSFYGKDRDNSVKTIRKDSWELSGIFNKASQYAKRILQTHSMTYESTVEDAKMKWLLKSDSTKRFTEEKIVKGDELYCPVALVFSQYNKFCKENGMTPLIDRGFNSKMQSFGFSRGQKKIDGANIKVWFGFKLVSELKKENAKIG